MQCKEKSQLNRIAFPTTSGAFSPLTKRPLQLLPFLLYFPLKASASSLDAGIKYRRHGLPYLPIKNGVKVHTVRAITFIGPTSLLSNRQTSRALSSKVVIPVTTSYLFLSLATAMVNTSRRILLSSFSYTFLSYIIFILLSTQPCSLYAQSDNLPIPSTTSSISSPTTPTLVNNPGDDDTNPTYFIPSSPSSAVPSATDSAGYGSHDDTSSSSSSPHSVILNYYFLLLAVFIIAVLIVYWTLARRRRRAAAQLSRMRQSVLSEDVRSWTRHRQAGYGFEDEERGRPAARVEGLDAAGEAPPAYVKEPEPVHLRGSEGVELRGMVSSECKPPDYEERPPPR